MWKKIYLFNADRRVGIGSGIKEVRSLETLQLTAVGISAGHQLTVNANKC